MPLKRGSPQPGDTGRGTRNPCGGEPRGFFVANAQRFERADNMNDTSSKRGFTTAILHSAREAAIEYGALPTPLHTSVAYGHRESSDLANVFQGQRTGYALSR